MVRAVTDKAPIDENPCESPSRLRAARPAHPARSISIAHEAQLLNRIALPAGEAYFPHSYIAFWRFTGDESVLRMRR
jgi:hypothetical protein